MPEYRVFFVATDYEATVGFFTDVMGLEVVRSFEEGGKGTILLAGDGLIEVFEPTSDNPPSSVSGVGLAWEVADAEAEHARLVAAGADIVRGPELQPWGHENFMLNGPDGWRITLFEIVVPQ